MANYYIDGTTLNNSTAVYDDAALTICAANGFYSDGISVREQVSQGSGCVLLPPQICPTCATPCGGTIGGSGAQGVYLLDLDVGGTATDTGAIVIVFDPLAVPDGVMCTYDGSVYNKLSAPGIGLRQSTVAGVPTYVGSTNSDTCGVQAGTYNQTIQVFNYQQGNFVNTGTTQNVSIAPGQGQLTNGSPGDCVMVVPKPNPSPATAQFQFIGPCGGTAWNVQIACPTPLTGFMGTAQTQTITDVCGQQNISALSIFTTLYHQPVPINGTQGVVTVDDYVFNDHDGVSFPADGFYLQADGSIFELQSGICVQVQDICSTYTVSDCLTGDSYTMNRRFGGGLSVGDVIQYHRITNPQTSTASVDPTVHCGTISSLGQGVTINAVQKSAVTYACNDATHCPQ